MGAPGIEHINIADLATAGRVVRAEFDRRLVDAFSPGAPTPSDARVLYVSPGDWVLPLTGSLDLPEQVEVMFAPGGRLLPIGAGAILRIHGKITAPIGPIFMTRAGASSALTPAESATLGRVELWSERLERVHPEWWGAGRLRHVSDLVSAAELQAIADEDTEAIEVAARVASDWRPDPVAVELVGTYLLARTVRVGRGPFPPADTPISADGEPTAFHEPVTFWDREEAEVELRGRLRAPEDPTLRAHTAFAGDEMIDVRSVASFRLRGVSFDTRGEATVCLGLRDPFQFTVTDAPHEITQCSFRGDFVRQDPAALLRIQRSHPYGATPDLGLSHSAPNVVVDACMFSISSVTGVAIRLIGEGAAAAEFRGCTFVGAAAAMIHASSFEVMAASCRFENTLVPGVLRSPVLDEATRARVLALHALSPQGGLDVFLDSAQELPLLLRPPDPPPPPSPPPSGGISAEDIVLGILFGPVYIAARAVYELARPGYITVTGSFAAPVAPMPLRLIPQRSIYAQECRSTSPQFLATAQNAARSSMLDGVIIGLHHEFRPMLSPQFTPPLHPPAIHWRAASGEEPTALILTGCRFDGASSLGFPRVAAPPLMSAARPAVIDYGLCDGNQPMGLSIRATETLTPGVRMGFVPLRVEGP